MILQTVPGMKLRKKEPRIPKCESESGMICKPGSCENCLAIFEQKFIEKRATTGMGYGLFANQNIEEGEYIVKYTGEMSNNKPDIFTEYTVGIEVQSKKGKTSVKYIDASNSRSLGKFANHSCVYNATFVEVFSHDNDVPQLWIRAHKYITMFEEITVHYGDDMFNYINEKYGCGCEKCYKPSA